jgi:hypothetical protein
MYHYNRINWGHILLPVEGFCVCGYLQVRWLTHMNGLLKTVCCHISKGPHIYGNPIRYPKYHCHHLACFSSYMVHITLIRWYTSISYRRSTWIELTFKAPNQLTFWSFTLCCHIFKAPHIYGNPIIYPKETCIRGYLINILTYFFHFIGMMRSPLYSLWTHVHKDQFCHNP